jgi:GT2 family glycosyltransferase
MMAFDKTSTRPILYDFTLLIPTLGRDILREALDRVLAGTCWPEAILIVDQGNNPTITEWMAEIRQTGIDARQIVSSKRGRAAGINRGLSEIQTRFVAITDDDCFVEVDWLENLAEHLMRHPKAIVTGRVEAAGDDMITVVTSRTPAIYTRPRLQFDSLSGGNMGTSLEVIKIVGPFDEDPRLRTSEDGDWAYRALRQGIPIRYEPDVVIYHFGWRNPDERMAQYRSYARSHGGFYGKHIRSGDMFILLRAIVHHARALLRFLRGVVRRDSELASFGWAYFTGLLPGMLSWVRKEPR